MDHVGSAMSCHLPSASVPFSADEAVEGNGQNRVRLGCRAR